MGCFNLIECLTQPRIYARASLSSPHRVAEISAVGLPWIDRYDFLLKCDRPGTVPLFPLLMWLKNRKKRQGKKIIEPGSQKLNLFPILNQVKFIIEAKKQSNAFLAKYLKVPALLQSSFSSCAFESEQKIQLNGCKSRDPSIKLLRNYFFQVRELLLNAEWE